MPNTETFSLFFTEVYKGIKDKTFAKLTLAKPIGKPELQNIYIKTIVENNELKLQITHKIYNDGLKEIVKIVALNELENETIPYINNPFMAVLLFTTQADITLKLNKKRVASITTQAPTFKNADPMLFEMKCFIFNQKI